MTPFTSLSSNTATTRGTGRRTPVCEFSKGGRPSGVYMVILHGSLSHRTTYIPDAAQDPRTLIYHHSHCFIGEHLFRLLFRFFFSLFQSSSRHLSLACLSIFLGRFVWEVSDLCRYEPEGLCSSVSSHCAQGCPEGQLYQPWLRTSFPQTQTAHWWRNRTVYFTASPHLLEPAGMQRKGKQN